MIARRLRSSPGDIADDISSRRVILMKKQAPLLFTHMKYLKFQDIYATYYFTSIIKICKVFRF